MVLDTTRRRTSPRRFLLLAAATGAAVLVPLSMLRPAVQAAPPAPRKISTPAEFEGMQRERQYTLENGRFMRGQGLTPKALPAVEHQLTVQPDDYTANLCLLGYYLNSTIFGKPLSIAAARPAFRQQVFWLIQNHPESLLFSREALDVPRRYAPAVFDGDEALWQAQFAKHPGSAIIFGNAAGYYLLSDKALSEKYLLRAQALEPSNPEWPGRLGELYRLNGPHPTAEVVQQSAKKALAEFELAISLADKSAQPTTLAELAKTAFDAGEYDKARHYAEALLKRGQEIAAEGKADPGTPAFIFHNNDDDIHEANLVLGRLALHDGNQTGAEAYLLAMGRVSASSSLSTSGPNMQLAQDLLERGDRAPVLAYFDECAKFWKDKQLGVWRSQVEQGHMPDFRGNLYY